MEEINSKKDVLVKLPEPETEEQKKKRNRRTFILFMMCLMTVSDVAGILAYLSIKYNKEESQYYVSEESISIHNNLLAFVKSACEDSDHPVPNQIVAIDYRDNQLLISSKNETNEIYVTYDCDGGIETALKVFQKGVPTSEGYSIESALTITDEKELNITTYAEDNNYVGLVSKSLTNQYYVSSTYLCTCGSLISIVHQPYDEGGTYLNKLSASKKDKFIYDLLHVVIHGIEQ